MRLGSTYRSSIRRCRPYLRETHGMKDMSAIVHLPPTSHSCFERTLSRTPRTRRVSFWYLSIALGIFSGWSLMNQTAWPKYGLRDYRRNLTKPTRVGCVPLTRRLEKEPLKLVHLLLEARDRDLVLGVIFVNKVLHNRVGLPVSHKSALGGETLA